MRRYLVVDDNQAFAENLAEILADTGAEVDVAIGGSAALERARSSRYDLVISDMRMPAMGGAELLHRLRQVDPGLPAIVITAYTNDADLLAARHEGLLAALGKPVPVDRLVELSSLARRDGLVVIIDDDLALSDNLEEALRARGFASVSAASVVEAERLGDVHPFAALVDLRVPGGPDGAAMAHVRERFPDLPVLVITGSLDAEPPGPHQGLFHKPFRTSDLLEAIEKLHAARHA